MEDKEPHMENNGDEHRISTTRKWMRGLFYAFLVLVLVLFSSSLLLQWQPVQQWAIDEISQNLSQRWNTEVSIGRVNFKLFDRFVFEDVLILDHHQDTAVSCERLSIDFMKPFKTLAYRHLVIEEVRMEAGRVNVKTYEGEEKHNLAQLWGASVRSDTTDEGVKPGLNLIVDRLWLDRVLYEKNDENLGRYQCINIPDGMARIGEVDFTEQSVRLSEVRLDSPEVFVHNRSAEDAKTRFTEEIISETPAVEYDTTKWAVIIKRVNLADGSFRLANQQKYPHRQRPKDVFDWAFLDFDDIDIRAKDFYQQDLFFTGSLDHLSLQSNAGFKIENMSAEECKVGRKGIALEGFHMQTPYTSIHDRMELKYQGYPDFNDFVNKVRLESKIRNSHLVFRDLIYFAPDLRNQQFFANNLYERIDVEGNIEGTINDLDARALFIQLGNRALLRGDFYSENLAVKGKQMIHLNIRSLETRFKTLRSLLPKFDPPPAYDRLGRIHFEGSYDGTFEDFSASGRMDTELGRAEMDLDMSLAGGRKNAEYSGDLNLSEFDLGTFYGNQDFGRVGLSATVKNGSGLTLEDLDVKLDGRVHYLNYKGYPYQNIEVDGLYKQQEFKGRLAIEDPNINFSLRGNILFDRDNPLLDFEADLQKMDLKALNLMDSAWVFSGYVDLNFEGLDIDQTTGSAFAHNAQINTYDGRHYKLDTVQLITRNLTDSTRFISVDSDVATMDMQGKFLFSELWPLSKKLANKYYPSFAQALNWDTVDRKVSNASLQIDLKVINTQNLLELIHPGLDTVRDASVNGYIQSESAHMHWEISIPRLKFKKWEFYDIYEYTNVDASLGNVVFTIDSTILQNTLELEAINLFADLYRDSIDFTINSFQYSKLLNQLNIEGVFYLHNRIPEVQIQNSGITLMGDKWTIDPDNYIRTGRDSFIAHNIQFTHGEKEIRIQSEGASSLETVLRGFDLELVNMFWAFEPIDFSGRVDGRLFVSNVFNPVSFEAKLSSDSLQMNDIHYGSFDLQAQLDSTKATPVEFKASLIDDEQQLTAEGHFYPPGKSHDVIRTVDVAFQIRQFPLQSAEFFLGDGISSTRGLLDGSLQLVGTENSMQLLGEVDLSGGTTVINYLGITVLIDETTIRAREDFFTVSGTTIRDIYGNIATIEGGVSHNDLRNFRLNASINSDRFLVLNTSKSNQDLYYGHCIGEVYTEFTGTFRQPNIYVNATTGQGTRFFIQTEYEKEAGELEYLRFVEKNQVDRQEKAREEYKGPRGLSLTLDLIATSDAEVKIIFDERAGDIIEGTGEGEIQLNVSRAGEVRMYGQYLILQGNYLFTLPVVKKPFEVLSGSTLRWTGDPLNANIDIEAQYLGLTASPYNLIADYIEGDAELEDDAKKSTEINLTLQLTGSLLHPEIAFDITFPNLTGRLKSIVDNRVEILRSDQNEMNRQVFGLIMLKSFLPTGTGFSGDYAARAMIFNTGSEFLSNLISVYLSDLLNQAVAEIDVISGIDVNVGYKLPTEDLLLTGDDAEFDPNKSEVQVQLRNRLFNDRIIFNVGGKHVSNSALATGSYVAGNVSFEYVLTEDRRLRIRAYTSTDQVVEGRRIRYGIGLNYRREFNTMENFLSGLREVLGLVEEDEKKVGRASGQREDATAN